nr:glutathione S-transferase T3-like [Aegilops tauschii subsp. strangulata]
MREDELLCDAWLSNSLDPVHGTEQKGTTFWRNIHIWFHEHKHFTLYSNALIRNREWKPLNHRWYTIQEVISKYCRHFKHLTARWPSGAQITEQPTRACVVYKKLKKKSFTVMHCWLKLNGQPKWNLFIAKAAAQANKEEIGDPTDPAQEPPKKIRRNLRGKKWQEERAKREGAAAKLTERFEEILAKKEEACVRRSDIKEERKAEKFKQLMDAIEKKIKLEKRRTMIEERKAALEEKKVALEEKRVKIAANAEDTKMLTLNINSSDADARIIGQSIRYQTLERQKDQLAVAQDEDVA